MRIDEVITVLGAVLLGALLYTTVHAHPLGDVNGDGLVNAVDVQLVINTALGADSEHHEAADINNDGVVNAVDVQLVINAALGISIGIPVHELTGLTQSEAEAALADAGLELGTVTEAFSDTVPAGHVISQSPPAGSEVLAGTRVDLVVSSGESGDVDSGLVGGVGIVYFPPGYIPDILGVTSSGSFYSFDIDLPNMEPEDFEVFGCTFFDSATDIPDPFLDLVDFDLVPLDPGEPGAIVIGTQEGLLERLVFSPQDQAQITYLQNPPYLDGGPSDIAELSWPGGEDIAAFSLSAEVIGPPQLMNPQIAPGTALDINFDEALPLIWSDPGSGDYITVTITTIDSVGNMRGAYCFLNDDGAHMIPAQIMSQLKHEGSFTYSMAVERRKMTFVDVPLVHGGEGTLVVMASSSVSGSGSSAGK